MSSKFEERENQGNIRNYGNLIIELSQTVPDGIVCFFTSYKYMEHMIVQWNNMKTLSKVLENKLIYIETPDNLETSLALENYKKACDNGRGAVFFSIARGKVSEGVDFAGHYGRCVVVFGIPYQNTLSRNLRARMAFLKDNFNINENDFLTIDAMRQTSQCVGRVLRSKYDYGLMIFADKRYARNDKKDKLPQWIRNHIEQGSDNISIDQALSIATIFFKEMG
jgi:DNA excision repair protein ERCC-2